MNYYVIEISTGDEKIKGKGIYEYATEREAVAAFHTKLGTAMKSPLFESELVMVVNKFGYIVCREYYSVNNDEPRDE